MFNNYFSPFFSLHSLIISNFSYMLVIPDVPISFPVVSSSFIEFYLFIYLLRLSTCFLKFFISLLIRSFALASSLWTLFYWVLNYVILNCKRLVGKCSCPWIMLSFLLWYLFLLHDALLCVCGVFVVDISFLFFCSCLNCQELCFVMVQVNFPW